MTETSHGHDHDFTVGERGFSHYEMDWGTVVTEPEGPGGFEGWFRVSFDKQRQPAGTLMNAERFVTPEVAQRYGYGYDPEEQAAQAEEDAEEAAAQARLVAGNALAAALVEVYRATDDDEIAVGEIEYEAHKVARLLRREERNRS